MKKNKQRSPRGELVGGVLVTKHPLYTRWAGMHARCYNKNSKSYERYGARGITVCERWHSFKFFAEDMGEIPFQGATMERIENADGYSPENCKWDTPSNQNINCRVRCTNTSGHTGVHRRGGAWSAVFKYEHVVYNIGCFATCEEAVEARKVFVATFLTDRDAAMLLLPTNKARLSSSTGVRGVGVFKNKFAASFKVDGERFHIGHFTSMREAELAREIFVKLFSSDRVAAIASLPKNLVRSRVGVRGVTQHSAGGYVVQGTYKKQRLFVGYFASLDEAIAANERFIYECSNSLPITMYRAGRKDFK